MVSATEEELNSSNTYLCVHQCQLDTVKAKNAPGLKFSTDD